MKTNILSRFALALALVIPTAAITACGSDSADTVDTDNGKAISDLDIGGDITIDEGAEKQMTATVKYADGTTKNVTTDPELTWNIGDPSNATISSEGVIRGVSKGTTTVKASYQGRESASKALIVH